MCKTSKLNVEGVLYTPSFRNTPSDGNTLFLYIETSLELKSGDSEIIIEHLGAAVTDCLKTLKIDLPISKINQCR